MGTRIGNLCLSCIKRFGYQLSVHLTQAVSTAARPQQHREVPHQLQGRADMRGRRPSVISILQSVLSIGQAAGKVVVL